MTVTLPTLSKIPAVCVFRGSGGDDSDIEMLEERGPLQNADNNQAGTQDVRNRSSANRSIARPSTVSQDDDNRENRLVTSAPNQQSSNINRASAPVVPKTLPTANEEVESEDSSR